VRLVDALAYETSEIDLSSIPQYYCFYLFLKIAYRLFFS
jgi:hypothetical protein